MDRHGLVEGYVRGDVTRRTFVRRLTMTGVSLAAALSYAELLRPATARAAAGEDAFYEKFYEQTLPPDVVTEAPAGISQTGGMARAQIDPNLQSTQVWFEYGPVGAAPRGTAQVTVVGDGDRLVEIPMDGLPAGTSCVVRAVAENRSGRTVGADALFATAAAPVAAAPVAAAAAAVPPPDTRKARFRRVRVRSSLKQVLKTGVLPIEVTTDEDAALELTATLRQQIGGVRAAATRTRKVTVATGRVRAIGGKPATAKLKIKRAGRRALKNKKAATLQLEIRATDRARNRSVRRQSLRLK